MDDTLGKLARATSIAELNTFWAEAPKDFPHRAIFAARYSTLKGTNSDNVVLKSLPTNGQEMQRLYDAQDTLDGQDMAVTDAYNAFYRAASEAVAEHPTYLPQFLRMIHAYNYVDNVDEWPHLCGLASTIYAKAPKQYMAAVKKLESEYREDALYCRNWPDAP